MDTENTYWGLYFSNAFDVTDRLTVTVGGRYNNATIKMEDNTGLFPGLNATNTYERFNPMAGANYKLMPGVSVYGGYSESNRAPTPAELGCAEPDTPCLIESFLTDDPPLDQVVGRTAEIGLRGQGHDYWWSLYLGRWLVPHALPRTTSCRSPTPRPRLLHERRRYAASGRRTVGDVSRRASGTCTRRTPSSMPRSTQC